MRLTAGPTSYIFETKEVPLYYSQNKNDYSPNSRDPPAISSHARKCILILLDNWDPPGRSVHSVVVNLYVHIA